MGSFQGVEIDDLELSGDRLLLRPWRDTDAARVADVLADPAMHSFLALPQPYTRADALHFIAEIATPERRSARSLTAAVVERTGGRLVGSAALGLGGDPEIGFWIAGDAQRQGYATEITTVLADWAFGVGLPRARLACDVRNVASARTALAAGFRFEGVTRGMRLRPADERVPAPTADMAQFGRLADDPPGRVPYAFRPLPPAGLEDGVLRLRTMLPADAPALAEMSNDAQTLRWDFTGERRSARQMQAVADGAGLQWLTGSAAQFAMVEVATGEVAGELRLRKAGPPQVGGLGYVVHPAFRGRGYATRALRLLVPWAFDVLGMARLELGAKVGNEASLRAAATAGFEPDGLRRARLRSADGSFRDEVRFALVSPRYM